MSKKEKIYIAGESKEDRKRRKRLEKSQKRKPAPIIKPAPPPPPVVQTKPKRETDFILETVNSQPIVDKTKTAFVLGNGTSRQEIDPRQLRAHGKIYGCNALYRTFVPDQLVAVDTKMIKEIVATSYHLENSVWTNPNRYTNDIHGLNLFKPNLGWSSGPSALHLASGHGYETIYILGFDYVGLGKKNELVNNIYSGTPNYKQINERATYFGNWQRQTATCIKKYVKVKYVRVIENSSSFVPESLFGIPNLTHITIDHFKKRFNLE